METQSRAGEPTIKCPECKSEIKLTESLAAPLIEATRSEYQRQLAAKDADIKKREDALRAEKAEVAKAKESVDEQVQQLLKAERGKIAAEEQKKARQLLANDLEQKTQALTALQEIVADRDKKLAEAQKLQADTLRKQRELDDEKRALDLTVETKVQDSLAAIRAKAKQEAEDELKLKVAERDERIASMQRQIDDLKRKADQGSQQLQGEVQELELESLLRAKFATDIIEPVPKGEFGGDVVQRVMNAVGQECGTILWETKRTKNWSDGWLAKLREDKRQAGADVALLVSQAVPKGLELFDLVEGVWVTESRCTVPMAIVLRQSLIQLAGARIASVGQQTKMEMVYEYLTGPRFRHRVEAIVEKFSEMQADLDSERRTMARIWAKRESQIRGVLESTAGMYGDLQGIAGKTLQEIEALDLEVLAPPAEAAE
ncbi:DUF2130 domain-containing protein [Methyloceanibacter sp.]|uniref:DUF2130 domain-containing protein n=1 Tax=Methyloceanibacter sp. TaxID=1965321 RepID=UPI002B7EA373|nr:DUF2130 domain-containing protein [Methyloceanibacter sp.]HML92945.1 DUF2130 domain-containing protein [Methyloceanibacter sp.]